MTSTDLPSIEVLRKNPAVIRAALRELITNPAYLDKPIVGEWKVLDDVGRVPEGSLVKVDARFHAAAARGKWAVQYQIRGEKKMVSVRGIVDGVTTTLHAYVWCLDGREPPNEKAPVLDHIDNDPLNNTIENLRLASYRMNANNRIKSSGKSSKYRGVCYVSSTKKFEAQMMTDDAMLHGTFSSEIDAAIQIAWWTVERGLYRVGRRVELREITHADLDRFVSMEERRRMKLKTGRNGEPLPKTVHYDAKHDEYKIMTKGTERARFKELEAAVKWKKTIDDDRVRILREKRLNQWEIVGEDAVTHRKRDGETHRIVIDATLHARMGDVSIRLSRPGNTIRVDVVFSGGKAQPLSHFVKGVDGRLVDHIDGDPLNNRASNLRENTTAAQNSHNRRPTPGRTLPMGVVKTSSGWYSSRINDNGKVCLFGSFETIEEASAAYDAAKFEIAKEFTPDHVMERVKRRREENVQVPTERRRKRRKIPPPIPGRDLPMGVTKHTSGKYATLICRENKQHYLGYYDTANAAKRVYDAAVTAYEHGELCEFVTALMVVRKTMRRKT